MSLNAPKKAWLTYFAKSMNKNVSNTAAITVESDNGGFFIVVYSKYNDGENKVYVTHGGKTIAVYNDKLCIWKCLDTESYQPSIVEFTRIENIRKNIESINFWV